ncbi:MAG: FAD-dependent oxidoreductase [Actinomycetota bacterium]|nr:FAD-dependent oxidoreductase [Actinomycetota bacterium]
MRIIVAGGGLAGLVAALRAAELGAQVTLLEKGDRLGGSFIYSSGYVWSYKDLPTFRYQAPGGDVILQQLILGRLKSSFDWLEDRGTPALARETGNPLTFGTKFDPEPVVASFAERISTSGGQILLGTTLNGLVRGPEGNIEGVRLTSGEGRRTARSDAVILASGGFAGSPELVRRYIIGGPGRMLLRAHPWSTGDGFLAALEAGALTSAGLDEFYGRNLPAPPAEFTPEEFVEVSQLYGRYAVAINRDGERYADEAGDWSETALVRATVHQPGLRAWYLVDSVGLGKQVRDRSVKEIVATARRVGGNVLQADSPEELATRLAKRGVPRAKLLDTLNEYNAAIVDGRGGELSPPRSDPAAPVQVPPFVAVEVAPAITHTIGGLAVNGECRVLRRTDRRPIPGLYACGVEVGGVAVSGYASGLAAALVFGRVAAASAVEYTRVTEHGGELREKNR